MQDRGESFMPQAQDQVLGKRIRMSGKVVLRSIKRVNSARSHHSPALQISILSRAKYMYIAIFLETLKCAS